MPFPCFRDALPRSPPAATAALLPVILALVLVLAAAPTPADAFALPRQPTKTVAYRELNVVAWPPLPTEPPISPFDLARRQEANTICGYIGGKIDLPATCSGGSHCVLDTDGGVIGCCPNGGTCTAGVFTDCVDGNSGPQTELNPYVYTCSGAHVCYKNQFAGGFGQYGCGTASEMGTSVHNSYDGAPTALALESAAVALTQTPTSLAEPTVVGTPSERSSSASQTSTSSSTSSTETSTSSSSTNSASSTATTGTSSSSDASSSGQPTAVASGGPSSAVPSQSASAAAAPPVDDSEDNGKTGSIVGGTVGGAGALMLILGSLTFFLRKRRPRPSPLPPPGPTPAVAPVAMYRGPPGGKPMSPSSMNRGPVPMGAGLGLEDMSPIPGDESGQFGDRGGGYVAPLAPWDDGRRSSQSNGESHDSLSGYHSEPEEYRHLPPAAPPPARYDATHMSGVGTGLTPVTEETLTPSEPTHRRSEIEDFSRHFSDQMIGQAMSDDRHYRPDSTSTGYPDNPGGVSPTPSARDRGGHRPLWQQNRHQSRNLMWV